MLRTFAPLAGLALAPVLAIPLSASDLAVDGVTSTTEPIGGSVTLALTGNPVLPALVLIDGSPGPVSWMGESVPLGFTPSFQVAASGQTGPTGLFATSAPLPDLPALVGGTLHLVGLVLDPSDPNGVDFSNAASLTLGPKPLTGFELPGGSGEDFTTAALADVERSGGAWGAGLLAPGALGGSGRLGDLVVTLADSPMVLDTDDHAFTDLDVVPEGSAVFPPAVGAPTATVARGVFEFARVVVEPGAVLQFAGSHPARLMARGRALVDTGAGIDVSGASPLHPFHDSSLLHGGSGGVAGPGGFSGGKGADRPDDTDLTLIALGAEPNPGAVTTGAAGGGPGGGAGGPQWPSSWPTSTSQLGSIDPNVVCVVETPTSPGAGGGFGLPGGDASVVKLNAALNIQTTPAPASLGGDAGLSALNYTLDPEFGLLRGGSGGGGGGLSMIRSQTSGPPFGECVVGKFLVSYSPHSGAGGGGGGGALQVAAGERLEVRGELTARGGDGATKTGLAYSLDRTEQAAGGGGGAGGALLLQAASLDLSAAALSVEGGLGAASPGGPPSVSYGGDGGAGLVRAESLTAPDPLAIAPVLLPYDPAAGSATGGASSSAILTTAAVQPAPSGPAGRSGSQSCWLDLPAGYTGVSFRADDLSDPLNPDLGWDATLLLVNQQTFSLRDATDPANPFGVSFEDALGSDLGGPTPSPVVIRFQGLRVNGTPSASGCGMDQSDPAVDADSLTPWVRHPAELNTYWDLALPMDPALAAARKPNRVRYQVIFDRGAPYGDVIEGLTHLGIRADLD